MSPIQNFSKEKQKQRQMFHNDPANPDTHKVVKDKEIANAKEWEKQIWFWRTHLDIFIEEYFSTPEKPIKLKDFQKVIARNCGNFNDIKDVEARSMGKTFKMGLILAALNILYSGNKCLIVSKTVRQAILTVKYIETLANDNPNLAREIISIKISKDGATVKFKNGSEIEALAMNADGSNLRGLRKKIIYIDESGWVKSDVIQAVLMPILQYKRDIYWAKQDEGFEDFESKLFETSSAYLKSCDFYTRFKDTLKDIKNGIENKFACALNYKTGVRCGIIDDDFVENQKRLMALSVWQMEWNSQFVGSSDGAFFPYDLTEPCRDLSHIEIVQPKSSKSRYVMSLDVATSSAKWADNACLTIVKISEKLNRSGKSDGTFIKHLVYIRTYHGYSLEKLAEEVRKMSIRFSNVEKICIDGNAIGEGVISLLNLPYVDDEGKEYRPLVPDTLEGNNNVIPIIRVVKADNKYNERMATHARMFLENKSLHLPIPSSGVRREQEEQNIQLDDDKKLRRLTAEELAVYMDTDGLQFEMGNIVETITASGNKTYDVAKSTQHKDRWSSLGMALEYIFELEDKNRDSISRNTSNTCWGVASKWN